MNWVTVFIQRHVLTWMIMASLILFGWIAFHRMGISEFPDVDFPVVDVGVSWDGTTPELTEKQLADPIENALSSVQGITKLYSVSRANGVSVTAEFELGTNIDTAVQDIQVALARIQRQLPREADPPIVRKTNPEDRPILWVSVASDTLSRADLMAYVKDYIRPRFSTIPGVAAIQLGGYVDPAIMIWAHPQSLGAYQLTLGDIIGSIQAEHLELPAGQLETPRQDIQVRLMGEANTPDGLAALPLSRRGGALNFRPLPLGAVATVEPGLGNERSIARSMGKVAVGLGFNKQRGSNAVAVGDAIKARLAELSAVSNQPLDIGITYDATTFVNDAIHELLVTLGLSGVLTTLVCWLFLGTWNATLNVALAIPTALFGAFIVMNAMGFTLNTFTLLGLSMAIGVVVDDAIMVLENITRHQAMGKSTMTAARDGTQEILVATIAASSVLVSLFLPVLLVSGILGTYLMQFGLTVCAAVAFSFVEAVTITPMRLARFQTMGSVGWLPRRVQGGIGRVTGHYRRVLVWVAAIPYRAWATLLASCSVLGVAAWVAVGLPRELTPYQDTNRFTIIMRGKLGTPLHQMDRVFRRVETLLLADPSVDRYMGFVGGANVNTGRVIIQLKPKHKRAINPQTGRPFTQRELADRYRTSLSSIRGARLIVQDTANRAFPDRRGFPIDLAVSGPDWATLIQVSDTIQQQLSRLPELKEVDSDYRAGLPEWQLIPNRAEATKRGVSVSDISKVIQAGVSGVIVGQMTGATRTDIRLRLRAEDRDDPADVLALMIRNSRGELVPLSAVVTHQSVKTLQEINRENKARVISLTANLQDGVSQADALARAVSVATASLPPGYRLQVGGTGESLDATLSAFLWTIGIGIVATWMVLASLFNRFTLAFVVLAAIPFSLAGSLVFLFLLGQSLNLFSGIGMMLSVGLVLKNAIMMVEFTQHRVHDGLQWHDAIIDASATRLRPILMTSLATIVGALPAAIAMGPGAETRVPLAISVMGGVLTSTGVSLLVIPAILMMFRVRSHRPV